MMLDVTTTAPADWDAYVRGHSAATAYHRAAAVGIGAAAFGLRTTFLTARGAEQKLRGVLPLVEQSSLLFGRFLISVPFFTYGGILADDEEAALALAQRAGELGCERRARHVELRHSAPIESLHLPERLDKVSLLLELPSSEEALSKQLGSKLRSQIRRAEREQPQVVWGGGELLDEFYSVFAPAMHRLGTPVYPRRFFDVFYQALWELTAVIVVRVRGQAEAAAIIVRHGARIEVPWAAATEPAKRAAVNMTMYWEMLRRALADGARAFDFGRSSVDSGTYRFKRQWGTTPQQLHWHYWLPAGGPVPQLNHSNAKYALAVKLWQRLPLWFANRIGPSLARHLP